MHKPPVDELVADMINFLDAGQREDFEERAGIIEFDGKFSRGHAECLALLDVLRRHPDVLAKAAGSEGRPGTAQS